MIRKSTLCTTDSAQAMILRSLGEHYELQTQERRADRGIFNCVPVGYLLDPANEVDFESFRRCMENLGGTMTSLPTGHAPASVTIRYGDRPPEIWAHSKADNYKNIYTDFCRLTLNVELTGSFKDFGFAVDHAYSRASIPADVDAYIRLFLVKAGPNSSWGAQYEKRLKELLLKRDRAGLREETVAIRAKLSGIKAPRKALRKSRNIQNVADVVKSLIDLGMTSQANFETDFATLAGFCEMIDGMSNGMLTKIDREGNTHTVSFPVS